MNILKSTVLALCLCLVATVAFAQGDAPTDPGPGDPPTETPSGLDIFYPGMTVQDAQKQGAVKAEATKMTGTVNWNGVTWDAVLLCKNDEVQVVGLKSKHIDEGKIATFLQDMQERLAFPLVVTRESNGKKEQTEFVNYVVQGKDGDALVAIFQKDVKAFLQQGEGTMATVFCHEEILRTLAENAKAKRSEDEKVMREKFAIYPMYSISINKAADGITVISSNFIAAQK